MSESEDGDLIPASFPRSVSLCLLRRSLKPPLFISPPRPPPGEAQPQTRSRPPCDNVRSIISSRGAEIMVKSLQPDDLDIQRGRAGEWTHRRGGVA